MKIKSLLLTALLIAALTLCGCSNEISEATAAVDNLFTALKTADFEAVSDYVTGSGLESIENSGFGNYETAMKALFGGLKYEITSTEKVDNETVAMTIDVTNVDMQSAFAQWVSDMLRQALAEAQSGAEMTDEERAAQNEKLLTDAINSADIGEKLFTVEATVVKEDGAWKLKADKTFVDSVTGGMLTAVENFNNSLDGEE